VACRGSAASLIFSRRTEAHQPRKEAHHGQGRSDCERHENDTTNETAGATSGGAADEAAAGINAPLGHYVPSEQDRRQRALELATYGGSGEHKEPIKSVLARAEAYRSYVETGETGIVA
jgi:hypothetical protein